MLQLKKFICNKFELFWFKDKVISDVLILYIYCTVFYLNKN